MKNADTWIAMHMAIQERARVFSLSHTFVTIDICIYVYVTS